MILILIITLMKMTLIILSLSDFWLAILNLKNAKHLKKDKWRINANSGILKVGEFLHVRRWEKRNLINFYWVMFLMYTIWKYWNILPLDIAHKFLWISSHFAHKDLIWFKSLWISSQIRTSLTQKIMHYTWRLVIVQDFYEF